MIESSAACDAAREKEGGEAAQAPHGSHGSKVSRVLQVPQTRQVHGVLVLNKPKGPTSARCLTAIKRLGQKKIGHAGTLDPMAAGVLLVLLGHATKISGHLMAGGRKVYHGELCLGRTTDTWDAEGTVLEEKPWEHIEEEDVRAAITSWLGRSEQTVPAYSAAKHQGQALYKLARSGKETPEKVKCIEISRVEVLSVNLPYARFRVECGSGTYIRSLAHSLGTRLGCGATLTELTREYSHPFGLAEAHSLEEVCAEPQRLREWALPVTRALPHWPLLVLSAAEVAGLKNGMPVPYRDALPQEHACDGEYAEDKAVLLSQEGEPLALAQKGAQQGCTCWTVLRGLWTTD